MRVPSGFSGGAVGGWDQVGGGAWKTREEGTGVGRAAG